MLELFVELVEIEVDDEMDEKTYSIILDEIDEMEVDDEMDEMLILYIEHVEWMDVIMYNDDFDENDEFDNVAVVILVNEKIEKDERIEMIEKCY